MKKNSFTSVKELPIMLSISQVAAVLNISRASAYELAHCKNFPAMLVGCRIVVLGPRGHERAVRVRG